MEKQHIFNALVDAIREVSPYARETIEGWEAERIEQAFLVDLGVSSIDYCQIANILMDQLDIHCAIDIFARTNNIHDVVDIFYHLSLSPQITSPATGGSVMKKV